MMRPPHQPSNPHREGDVMSKPFEMSAVELGDKQIEIWGPHELVLYVDYDDVNHESVMADTEKFVAILNTHWTEA